ncbi:hypothetical protein PCANC_10921 [Puccinia coronata f. sp. avenae]|uniref:VTT domain-containing protein n=1 Tax=Puccinia coronata f. sp. avenae TaxID=200324 RepID=A0A2N5SZU8_9BASI|nr:hypothetical protein PCANC_10921 [Puccinia coronata f. sp. avenae]
MSTLISASSKSKSDSRKPLQLLNPQASPYVSLTTPSLLSPSETRSADLLPFRRPAASHQLALSTSQHTLKTLAGGKYYDEYDEDDQDQQQLPLFSPSSLPHSASHPSFPPSATQSAAVPPPPHPTQPQSVKAHIINFNTHHSLTTTTTTPRHHPPSSIIPSPHLDHPSSSSSSSSSSLPSFTPHSWNHALQQKPLLAFVIRAATLLLLAALLVLSLVWALLPPIDEKDLPILRIPTSFEALKKLNALLQIYKTANYYRVLSSFVLIYLFLQTFSLPGSMYLSILAGAMFGVQVALPLVCLCVGTGAMLCYLMSLNLASSVVIQLPSLRSRLEEWKLKLSTKTNKLDLFAYLVVIRISPLPPHWVVNLLAPHVGIRLGVFWLTTCLGILPVTLIHTQLGTTLDQMVGPEDLSFFTLKNLTGLGLVAVGVLVPVAIRWYLRNRLLDESPTTTTAVTITAESRPFSSRRIGLSLEEEEEEHLPHDPLARRHHAFRSLSGQTYDHSSSITSLHKLARVESDDTLVLDAPHLLSSSTSSASDPKPPRPVPRHYPLPSSYKPLRGSSKLLHSDDRARLSSTTGTTIHTASTKEATPPRVANRHRPEDQPLDEIKFSAEPEATLLSARPQSSPHHPHHLHPRPPHHLHKPLLSPSPPPLRLASTPRPVRSPRSP